LLLVAGVVVAASTAVAATRRRRSRTRQVMVFVFWGSVGVFRLGAGRGVVEGRATNKLR
jgi:hypothetical protein